MKPEVLMKYVKDIRLTGKNIASSHGRLRDVNDILRFEFSHFLVRMGEPQQDVQAFDPAIDAVRTVACPKTYHINLVLVLRAEGEETSAQRFRVILNKRGITRLEEVEPGPTKKPADPKKRSAGLSRSA
jgi:hypothetical protein